MELIFNPLWISVKSGGPHQPNPVSSPPRWCPWDIFRSSKVCSDTKKRVGCGKQRKLPHLLSLVKLQTWFLSLRWKTCLWAELQPWFLSLQWKTYPDRTATLVPGFGVEDLPLSRIAALVPEFAVKDLPGHNCSLGSWVCGGRPAFGQNCSLGSWVYSKRPTLGPNTLMKKMMM